MIMPAPATSKSKPPIRRSRSNATAETLSPTAIYSDDAEKAVIGSMMAQPGEVMDDAKAMLSMDDFFVPAHQEIFRELVAMWNSGVAIDVYLIHQRLIDRKLAESVGSPGILSELLTSFASHLNVGFYIQEVKKKSMLRALQRGCVTVAQDIAENPDKAYDVAERASSLFSRIDSLKESSPILDAAACVARFNLERDAIQRGEGANRMASGIMRIDEANGGFPLPGFVVIASGPGGGKTAIAGNLLANFCSYDIGVGVFSLEMTIPQLIKRAVASAARIDSRRLNGKIHDAEQLRVDAATNEIRQWPFWIDETANLTPADLRSKCRQLVKKGAKVIELDYLQLMRGSNRQDERREQVAEITRTIKLLTNELGILFIVLAQVNREGRKRGELQLSDLAESSTIEQDADAVLLLERKAGCDGCPTSAIPYIARWAKYRDGSIGDMELTYNAPELRFT